MKIAFAWHIHQPFFIPNKELKDKVAESYENILRIHKKLEVPITINTTGALLERLENTDSGLINQFRKFSGGEMLDLLASGYHHPALPLLNDVQIKFQIERDIELKNDLLNVSCSGFWPPELAWSHKLVPTLAEYEIEWVILDSLSLLLSNVIPQWNKREVFGNEVLSPDISTLSINKEIHHPYETECLDENLKVVFRDHELSRKLVDSENGLLFNENKFDQYTKKLNQIWSDDDSLLVLGGDGERINTQTVRVYRKLLDYIKHQTEKNFEFTTISAFMEETPAKETRFFPGSTFLYDLEPWTGTMEDKMYLLYLQQIQQKYDLLYYLAGRKDKKEIQSNLKRAQSLLARAEDSSCVFWHYLSRTREPCYECAVSALKEIYKGLRKI